jgi:ferredoxin-NADP reductase
VTAITTLTDAVTARRRFHPLRIGRIVRETPQARSIVFDVPADLAVVFAYKAGQFVTIRALLDGEPQYRSCSMSSSPVVDDELRVTVKRVRHGLVSNWLNDDVAWGDVLQVSPPTGSFRLDQGDHYIVAFAAGSGITPLFSILRTALATSDRRVRLFYANHDRASTIFGAQLQLLEAQYADRLEVEFHEDVVRGFVTHDEIAGQCAGAQDAAFYLCGPGAFMDTVEAALGALRAEPSRVYRERFTPAVTAEPDVSTDGATVTIRLGRTKVTTEHREGSTLLQTARFAGLRAPSSCETGSCATCMARVVRGRAEMRVNDALTQDEVDEGWVLACQAVPVTREIEVDFE